MPTLIDTITHHWLLCIIAIILIILIARAVFRTAIKLALILLIIGILCLLFVGHSPTDLLKKGTSPMTDPTHFYEHTLQPLLEDQLNHAHYKKEANGDYVISANHLKITGQPKAKTIVIHYKGKAYTIDTKEISNDIKSKIAALTN
ncbi:hypothetical protein GCM10011391_17640 [Pullulanibacillus camelliae]|uniref:Uncharacterized protein n=1 Tax=Pullulanibacillus camelliae TaxID=1707096 RepID=A0A8J2YEX8_9BACL|nr:hypothetical protein [Pullulanibacillus camelliae]GGE39333.1 hypothetical protein GCM10011391_17640 [Pullulanibacillus camelliae]